MANTDIIWLASYPRSGNTLLRTILWNCFELHSASIYPDDLGGNRKLEEYVGHLEHGPEGQISFAESDLPLVKTHELNKDNNKTIYVIRDGRAASVSLWQFFDKSISLEAIIEGQHRFGTWSNHVQSWNPLERPNTLLLEYEKLVCDMDEILKSISRFLGRDIINNKLPDRRTVAKADGKWVKAKSNWRAELSGTLLKRFNQINKESLKKMSL